MKLSVIIPAFNEENEIKDTALTLANNLENEKIDFEILIINDNSTDNTENILKEIISTNKNIRYINNSPPNGIGMAIRKGLKYFDGDAVAIVMADSSDDPGDVIKYYKKLKEGYDCVFGSRFLKESKIQDYPKIKLIINRFANLFIRILFGLRYNDITNAFKMYTKETIDGLKPFLSHHFNITVELPLKAITRGYTYTVVPNSWYNRKSGVSKLKIKEMGSRYLFIVLYCLIEKWLSVGDYKKEIKTLKRN